MTSGSFRFDRFELDPADRTLRCDGVRVDLNTRYFDALALLLRERGRLIAKDRFLREVWRGVPVTDEALTQCIRTLRRQLGDDAARPRFIETVPKHGYRFLAAADVPVPVPVPADEGTVRRMLVLGGGGTVGAGVAGVVGGLIYGSLAASEGVASGPGGASVLLVVLWLTVAAALTGGAGVSGGIAAAALLRAPAWRIAGGAAGGLAIGGVVRLLGVDAFNLLLGRSPEGITGAGEGLVLGAAVGAGAWLAARRGPTVSLARGVALAGLAGGVGAAATVLMGGRLMVGSLNLVAQTFSGSRLRLGASWAQSGVGSVVTGGLEGVLFGACIIGGMMLAVRRFGRSR